MDNSSTNDIIDGLLSGVVAIRIPDDSDEALNFLERLSEAVPDLRWNDGGLPTEFNPSQSATRNYYYHKSPNERGLMYDSRNYIEEYLRYITAFVDADEAFNQTTDCSNLLNDLL